MEKLISDKLPCFEYEYNSDIYKPIYSNTEVFLDIERYFKENPDSGIMKYAVNPSIKFFKDLTKYKIEN